MKTVFWPALIIFFALAVSPALAQNTAEGQIYTMSVLPEEQIVFEELSVSVGVVNPSEQTQNYKLDVLVSKDGEIISSFPSVFTLEPELGTFVTETFVPQDIGEFIVIAKLTDQLGVNVKDIQIRKVNVISEIGPFDIAIDAPSKIVIPGTSTPLILTLANMGEKATDVKIRVELECNSEPNIEQEFFVFLFPGAVQDKEIATNTCQETGAHDITASVIVFNKTWITAVNQIFLNESFIELALDIPETITVTAGESEVFDVRVTNEGNSPINDLRLIIPRLPKEWVEITPSRVVEVQAGQTILFIVNLTLPTDTRSDEIDLGVSAAADQVLKRNDVKLKILSFEGEAPEEFVKPPALELPKFDLTNLFGPITAYLGIGIAVSVGGFIAAMKFRRLRPTYRGKTVKLTEELASLKENEMLREEQVEKLVKESKRTVSEKEKEIEKLRTEVEKLREQRKEIKSEKEEELEKLMEGEKIGEKEFEELRIELEKTKKEKQEEINRLAEERKRIEQEKAEEIVKLRESYEEIGKEKESEIESLRREVEKLREKRVETKVEREEEIEKLVGGEKIREEEFENLRTELERVKKEKQDETKKLTEENKMLGQSKDEEIARLKEAYGEIGKEKEGEVEKFRKEIAQLRTEMERGRREQFLKMTEEIEKLKTTSQVQPEVEEVSPPVPKTVDQIKIIKTTLLVGERASHITTVEVEVKNVRSDREEKVSLSIVGVPDEWVTVSPAEFDIPANETRKFLAVVNIPKETEPRDYEVTVVANSAEGSDRSTLFIKSSMTSEVLKEPIFTEAAEPESENKKDNASGQESDKDEDRGSAAY